MPDVVVGIQGTGAGESIPTSDARGRLTDAFTRIATECGYDGFDVAHIAEVAGVPVEQFNREFAGKDQCFLAAYDRFIERMLDHVEEACMDAETWIEKVKVTIESAFEFIAELEGPARLFTIETRRAGPAALERSCASIDSAALRLKHGRLIFPASATMPEPTERTLIAGLVMTVAIYLLAEEADQLEHLAPECVEMILTPYIGARRARYIASAEAAPTTA
jgi:AcrR family transcriptional regulator